MRIERPATEQCSILRFLLEPGQLIQIMLWVTVLVERVV
jgi:hypothetical protein